MNDITTYDFNNTSIRVVMDDAGEPWFVAKDVADALDMRDAEKLTRRLPAKTKVTLKVGTPGGEQQMLCINEQGLNMAVLRSNKPEAEPFIDWVCGEVLPSIRKTGQYSVEAPSPAKQALAMAQALVDLEAKQEVLAAQQRELAEQQAALAEAIEKKGCGDGYYPVAAFATKYSLPSLPISEMRRIGRTCGTKCRAQGVTIGKVPDERWYQVNSYPEELLREAFHECGYSIVPELKIVSSHEKG